MARGFVTSDIFCYVLFFIVALGFARFRQSWKAQCISDTITKRLGTIRDTREAHPLILTLRNLIDIEGAGSWPPRANYDGWPPALQVYHEIYLDVSKSLAVSKGLEDWQIDLQRLKFRQKMQDLLSRGVHLPAVIVVLTKTAQPDERECCREILNAFYCCIANSRHAYRWAVIPVVKAAQLEMEVLFPPELDIPWSHLQKIFGLESDSGNNTSNVLHNFSLEGKMMYTINHGISDVVTTSEQNFFRLFHDLEIHALPIYNAMIESVVAFERGRKKVCIEKLKFVAHGTQALLQIFYNGLTENRVSKTVWLSHIQGFQGWAIGRHIDGQFVKYDGISGSHVLFFQVLDAFLGIERYLSDENMRRSIPQGQRAFCECLRKHSFRSKIIEKDSKMNVEFAKMVRSLKAFRAAHRARVIPYLKVPAPERLVMTAGKSLAEGTGSEQDFDALLKPLKDVLTNRLRQTR